MQFKTKWQLIVISRGLELETSFRLVLHILFCHIFFLFKNARITSHFYILLNSNFWTICSPAKVLLVQTFKLALLDSKPFQSCFNLNFLVICLHIFFFFFPSLWRNFPSVSVEIFKIGKYTVFQLWSPIYFFCLDDWNLPLMSLPDQKR